MLQIILALAFAIEISIYVFLAQHWWEEPLSLLFIAPLILCLIVAVRILVALPSYWLATVFRRRDGIRQSLGNSLYALAKEIDSRAVIFNVSQLFHQWLMPEGAAKKYAKLSATPVLLVHGYFSNRGIFWQLRKRLMAAQIGAIYTLNLEPLLGSIDRMVPLLDKRIEQICAETKSANVIVVAHSMGGLVTRKYMAGNANLARIKCFISIGTPHHGSQLAAFGTGQCVQDMRPGSKWLAALELAEKATIKPPTLSIYTLNEDLVYPPESSKLDWAVSENVSVVAVGHVSMLFSKPIAARVIAEIKKV